jgi:hypothetical protein
MKVYISLFIALLFIFSLVSINRSFTQDVAIFYDANIPVLGINDGPGFAGLLVDELKKKNIMAEIVDSKGLADYMKANPTGIMLVSQGLFPGTIFANKGKDDLVYSWLRGGGIGGFAGDYPFYYWDNTANVAAGGGQQKIFGVTVTNSSTANVEPTELGKKYIPSLQKQWTSNRPVGLAVLQNSGFEFESYADDKANSDPVAYRTKDMKGWFINFHTSCCGVACPANGQMAKEYAELISNRFIDKSKLNVEPLDKLSVSWGQLKYWR